MQVKCVLIDDEPLALEVLKQYIARFPALKLLHSFDDAIEGAEYLKDHPADLLFIDINMPDIKGTDLVRSLPQKPLVIFTTAYKNYALEGFELDAVDYLLKPIEFERFGRAVQKALELHQLRTAVQPEGGSLFVRSDYRLVKIRLSDIEYIESVEDYIKIYISGERPVMTLMTMKAVQEKLPAEGFARIHRSYIVPLARVRSVVNKKVLLHSGTELPVGNSYTGVVKGWREG